MEASTSKEYGDFAKSLEDELLNFTADFEETDVDAYFVDKEDNVVEDLDLTESSSSFDGSESGDEGVDAPEVASGFSSRAGSAFDFTGPDNLFGKRYIHPRYVHFVIKDHTFILSWTLGRRYHLNGGHSCTLSCGVANGSNCKSRSSRDKAGSMTRCSRNASRRIGPNVRDLRWKAVASCQLPFLKTSVEVQCCGGRGEDGAKQRKT